jgi:hypothetical protein
MTEMGYKQNMEMMKTPLHFQEYTVWCLVLTCGILGLILLEGIVNADCMYLHGLEE